MYREPRQVYRFLTRHSSQLGLPNQWHVNKYELTFARALSHADASQLPFHRTGLPVHVHASWALQSNRRELWSNIDDGGQGQHNVNLLQRCVAPAWVALLHRLTVQQHNVTVCFPALCVVIKD